MVGASGGELGSGIVVSTRQSLCELTSQAFSLHLNPFYDCAMLHYCTFLLAVSNFDFDFKKKAVGKI